MDHCLPAFLHAHVLPHPGECYDPSDLSSTRATSSLTPSTLGSPNFIITHNCSASQSLNSGASSLICPSFHICLFIPVGPDGLPSWDNPSQAPPRSTPSPALSPSSDPLNPLAAALYHTTLHSSPFCKPQPGGSVLPVFTQNHPWHLGPTGVGATSDPSLPFQQGLLCFSPPPSLPSTPTTVSLPPLSKTLFPALQSCLSSCLRTS